MKNEKYVKKKGSFKIKINMIQTSIVIIILISFVTKNWQIYNILSLFISRKYFNYIFNTRTLL